MTRQELIQRFKDAAWSLRLGRDAEAMLVFPDLVTELSGCFERGWLDLNATAPVLEELMQAQERRDLLLVADILEHLIAGSLGRGR